MSRTVISVEKLGKEYVIGARENGIDTFREMIVSAATAPFRRVKRFSGRVVPEERVWALKDVSFEVKEGEVLGIIGRNGAGKSTLLKIISRITAPTRGRVEIRGRVASLLEVGTGFHSELTGRENIYLNGAILGMSRAEINRKFYDIVDFSGVEKFLDTPVKRYSSGMLVRLAFAVAAHLEPEILVVDEVLAVGDAEFQKKCLCKMSEVATGGRTVLFVSHNMGAIRALCGRGLVLSKGRNVLESDPEQAIASYLSEVDAGTALRSEWTWPAHKGPGNGEVFVRAVRLIGEKSAGITFWPDESVKISIEYNQTKFIRGMRFVLSLLTEDGSVAFATSDLTARKSEGYPPGEYRTVCTVPANLLNCRAYMVRIYAGIPNQERLIEPEDIGRFVVTDSGVAGSVANLDGAPGVLRPMVEWTVERFENNRAPTADSINPGLI